ncbi:RNA12 protein-domain-containing protein [Naematelia encephala]|uniref:Mitochondrial escape protein 2 n=1 Tax=Naematelia encephala TaxID=71784 RepID=A0A1Y2B5D0_9TREE|nr:RNA12 protein-domain-containing protein [Naematelia encephala]
MLRRLPPLKHPLRQVGLIPTARRLGLQPFLSSVRLESTSTAVLADSTTSTPPESERKTGSFYISNVFPIRLAYWDPRPSWAVLREESLMERLHDIGSDITIHDFRVESWEIERKDGGVFCHFSYIPPAIEEDGESRELDLSGVQALPEVAKAKKDSPGRLFLPHLLESASRHGGFPSWLGQWWANRWAGQGAAMGSTPGHTLYSSLGHRVKAVGADEEGEGGTVVKGSGSGLTGIQAAAGGGRVWVVKGRQWTEDMNRFPSNRLRVEFDGPDVSQEMLYLLFRPYGRVADIQPPTPVPAGSLRFASVSFSKISPAAAAINCLHGYNTPTNTADFTLRVAGFDASSPITLSRLRLYYERPLKAHAVRDWISAHPRIALPVLAFLIGTLSYTFFDPIRAFFVRSKLEGVWDIENYSIIKTLKAKFLPLASFSFFRSSSDSGNPPEVSEDAIGKDAWEDRIQAEKDVERWLSEYPSTFITITGPPGSGKTSLVSRVLKKEDKPALVIDCAEIAKSKTDPAVMSALAEQTGYYPVFSFLSSLNGLIDLASMGLIGQKAGFSTPVDQQLRAILEIVGGALKDVSLNKREEHQQSMKHEADRIEVEAEHAKRRELIMRGGWHDGRLDCIAGNGVMSELGLGEEPTFDSDLTALPPPLADDVAPIHGEAVPPTAASLPAIPKAVKAKTADIDEETEIIRTLPIVVFKNFAQKSSRGDLWNVLSEWGANLVENHIAHVIVITEGPTATKALTRALPTKPLNSVGLADADQNNSLAYVRDKLAGVNTLSMEDSQQIAKLGGRMVELETLVYKVRTGSTIKDAVNDIVVRNVVELRKQAFGDDAEDAKALPWTKAQAWKVVQGLAKSGQMSHAKLLQDFPFKGAEQSLKALEEHELISVSYHEGRASMVKPGKPVFRYVFEALVEDPVFRATCQIDYNTTLIAKAESDIRACEAELASLKDITTNGGDAALGVNEGGFLGLGKNSAIRERAKWLLEKMGKSVEKLGGLEKENTEMMKILSVSKE